MCIIFWGRYLPIRDIDENLPQFDFLSPSSFSVNVTDFSGPLGFFSELPQVLIEGSRQTCLRSLNKEDSSGINNASTGNKLIDTLNEDI